MRPTITHSSSADDYRSVIDDLTIENKRLREELKRYRQFGPGGLKKDKLFEIKVHGLSRRKKRELESTLRNFAASLEGSSDAPSQRKKTSKHANMLYSLGDSPSKHPSSSSSHSKPVDSAYASMSSGNNSSGTSMARPAMGSRAKSNEQKVEHYLEEIPEGLYPGVMALGLNDRDKQKLVVKKLEHLFTGKITGHNIHRNQSMSSLEPPIVGILAVPPSLEPAREAWIQQELGLKKGHSRDNFSTSNSHSNEEQTESGGNGNGSGGGDGSGGRQNPSAAADHAPEQRPTRPRDLDPDRIQIPSENMEYIRHLGLVPPELLAKTKAKKQDVSPDADGWVYLNLLSNLAQLHMLNVSPDFIRKAVLERSAKFQLSPDGRKIRWRGGSEGTKFTSDSSGEASNRSPSTDDDDGSDKNGRRKRQKTGDGSMSAPSSKDRSKTGPQVSGSSESFHYKPLFTQQSSSLETSLDDTDSMVSYVVEDSNGNNSGWGNSGSGSGLRKRRRDNGAMVFYSGAPFCMDLSGDPGDISPTTYMTSSGQQQTSDEAGARPVTQRSFSGASIPFRPLTNHPKLAIDSMEVDVDDVPDLTISDTQPSDDLDSDFPWCDDPNSMVIRPIGPPLEACGVGNVFPEDHFAVVVTTRHKCGVAGRGRRNSRPPLQRLRSDESAVSISHRLAALTAGSPTSDTSSDSSDPHISIEYLSGKVKRLNPMPLPPPARFFPPFSSDSDSDDSSDYGVDSGDASGEFLATSTEEVLSRRANPHQSDNTYPDGKDLSSGDEEDEHGDDEGAGVMAPPPPPLRKGVGREGSGSSLATAGGLESGYSSSREED
jgi:hypothetical protein